MRGAADARAFQVNGTAAERQERILFVLSTLPPTRVQTRLALGVVLALVITFLAGAGPLSDVYPGRIAAFVPAYATAMFVSQTFTSVLLFAQFSIFRTRALLALSSGYLFTALVLIPWTLVKWRLLYSSFACADRLRVFERCRSQEFCTRIAVEQFQRVAQRHRVLVGCAAASMRYHDEIRVFSRLMAKSVVGNNQ